MGTVGIVGNGDDYAAPCHGRCGRAFHVKQMVLWQLHLWCINCAIYELRSARGDFRDAGDAGDADDFALARAVDRLRDIH